jgi:hypothetical protein
MKRSRKLTGEEELNRGVISFFFNLKNPTKVEKIGGKEYRIYTCACGKSRRVQLNCGYTNLWSHICKQHPDYEEQYNRHVQNAQVKFLSICF